MTEPLYRQIAEDLQGKITVGTFPPGAQVPTEIELRETYGASRNTVRDAIKWLTTRGLVETRAGQGTFVVEEIQPYVTTLTGDPERGRGGAAVSVYIAGYMAEVAAAGRRPEVSIPRVEVLQATEVLADALRVAPGSALVSRHQQRLIDGIPWSLQTSFYPMSLVERGAGRLLIATDIEEGTVAYIADVCGTRQAGYRDTVSVRAPNDAEAAFFKLPGDGRISVFEIYRVGFDEDGGRIRLTVTVCPADRNRFRIEVGEVPPRSDD